MNNETKGESIKHIKPPHNDNLSWKQHIEARERNNRLWRQQVVDSGAMKIPKHYLRRMPGGRFIDVDLNRWVHPDHIREIMKDAYVFGE